MPDNLFEDRPSFKHTLAQEKTMPTASPPITTLQEPQVIKSRNSLSSESAVTSSFASTEFPTTQTTPASMPTILLPTTQPPSLKQLPILVDQSIETTTENIPKPGWTQRGEIIFLLFL